MEVKMYKLNYFNFRERKNNYLITNDMGKYSFISKENFKKLVKKQELDENIKQDLKEKGFIYEENEEIFATDMAMKLRRQKEYLLVPTTLHIFVISKNCNFNCIYCQAGNLNQKVDYKMTKEIAQKAVDIAIKSPSQYLTFEFQGGEPLTRLGKANENWKNIGYKAEEFLEFYKKSLDYIIQKNREGIFLSEGHSNIFLKKILLNQPVNYMELRSPCGGAIGQLAYYYDGDIYTCDEGRMLSEMGNDSFLK
jgi:hypothetical protein